MLAPVGWALANIFCLAIGADNNSKDSGRFTQGLDFSSFIRVVIVFAENLLTYFEEVGWTQIDSESLVEVAQKQSNILYTDLLKPVCQQWHLMKLLTLIKDPSIQKADEKCELTDVSYYYSCMLRIFTILNPVAGSMHILNMLSFTPGFLLNLWGPLEKNFFPKLDFVSETNFSNNINTIEDLRDGLTKKKKKWVNVLNKITGKSQGDVEQIESVSNLSTQIGDDPSDVWDIEPLSKGPEGLTADDTHLIHLFCATYSHLLLVVDDIEFYEKQVV